MGCLCSCAATLLCCGKMRSCCYCCGLAIGGLIFSCVWVVNGIYQICVGALTEDKWGNIDEDWLLIILGSINLLIGVGGLCACFLKISCGAMVLFYCYAFSFLMTVIAFIIQWVDWGTKLDADPPELEFEPYMVHYTVIQTAIMISTYFVCDIFYSMAAMIDKGQNVWVPGGGGSDD